MAVRTTVIEAFQKESKSPLVLPRVNVTKYVPGEMAEYTATADIIPEVKLADFKKLGVKKPEVKVSEKDVNGIIDDIRSSFAEKKVAKKAAESGDEVVIDFVGKKDGEAFKGGSAKDYKLVLGSKTFIPGFEDGIIGHASGDKFDLKLTFPKDYGVKELAGAKTVFEILVKQVNEVKKPKLDDELAQKCGPFKTVDELKADIRKNLEQQNAYKLKEQFKDELVKALVKKSKIPAPEVLINDQLQMVREIAEERVMASLALQTLAVEQKIIVSDDEVAAKLAELRDVYKKSPEALKQLKDPNVKMNIKNRLMLEAALELLVKEIS